MVGGRGSQPWRQSGPRGLTSHALTLPKTAALPDVVSLSSWQQKAAAERQKIVSAFEQLRRFLEEQERLMLAELGEAESRIEKSQGETVTQLSEEISHLTSLIRELEGKCQQAASDLLQDMRSTLSRYVAPPDFP
ncbi:E3 ubiquitin-protein ligase TRIM15-like [Alligator mississippiensis]|uniref:E3 ubiquitin-protein ligase TRIM15-like n=1 Tax=Alligator mississippiensis TaxID=8496 RepID=UPI00287806E2|nr:E3 ubiquitin-protein ligase TRIM15-like [Alligator mississippiensis]